MVIVNVAVAVFCTGGFVFDFVSCTSTEKVEDVLVLLGVPEIAPVLVSSFSPFGSLVDEPGAHLQV